MKGIKIFTLIIWSFLGLAWLIMDFGLLSITLASASIVIALQIYEIEQLNKKKDKWF
jgi:hypothetical protein